MAAQLRVSAGNGVVGALLALTVLSTPASAEVLFDVRRRIHGRHLRHWRFDL
jgi:hypothetical protein